MKIVRNTSVVDAGWLIHRLSNCYDAFREESSKEEGDVKSGLDFLAVGIALRKDLSMELLVSLNYQQKATLFRQIRNLCQCFEKTFEMILVSNLEKSLFDSIKVRKESQVLSYGDVIDIFTSSISRCKAQVVTNEVGYNILYFEYNLPLALIPILKSHSEGKISSDVAFRELCSAECILRRWRRSHFRCI